MANTNNLTAQAHLAAGLQKLEVLRRNFLVFLEIKEQLVFARIAAGRGEATDGSKTSDLSEWLG